MKRRRDEPDEAFQRVVRRVPLVGPYAAPYFNQANLQHFARLERPMAFRLRRRGRKRRRAVSRKRRGRRSLSRRRRVPRRKTPFRSGPHHRAPRRVRFRKRPRRMIHEKRVQMGSNECVAMSPLDVTAANTNWKELFPMYGAVPTKGTESYQRIGDQIYIHGEQLRCRFLPVTLDQVPDHDCKLRFMVLWVYGDHVRAVLENNLIRNEILEPAGAGVGGLGPYSSATLNDFYKNRRNPLSAVVPLPPSCKFKVILDKVFYLRSYGNAEYEPKHFTLHLPPRTVEWLHQDNDVGSIPRIRGRLVMRLEQFGGNASQPSAAVALANWYHPEAESGNCRWKVAWNSKTTWSDPS